MAKLSTIEIAAKQRHVFLLGKVKENKALSRAELAELKRYERQAAGKITAKAKVTSKARPKKKKRKAAAKTGPAKKKTRKKKAIKKKRARPPIDEAEVRRLGLECENMTEADAAIRTRRSLPSLLRKYPQLRKAWDRGRFLRNLRGLARTGASVSEAAKKFGFANGRVLQTMLDEDEEVGDLWKQTQLELSIEIKSAIIDAAKEGKADAVRAVENFLLDEKEQPGTDLTRISILQLVELTGRARQTIHDWYTKFGLPRNADKTFDLSIFLAWFEEFLLKKAAVEKGPAVALDPLKAMKAEKLKVELARHRNEILDRNAVMISLVAWAQHIVSFCDRGNVELSRLCVGQPRDKIIEIHKRFFQDLHAETARVPKELNLPEDKEKELVAFMNSLKPEKGGPGHDT
jgi:hypothetical protein